MNQIHRKSKIVSIGELAARSGFSVSKIRYYESIGLVHAIRSQGGNRMFLRADHRRLGFIAIAQRFGYSLEEIAGMLARLPEGRTPNRSDWEKISRRMKRDIEARISELQTMRDKLDGCIGCGCLSLDRCALYNPDDEAASGGMGPKLLREIESRKAI